MTDRDRKALDNLTHYALLGGHIYAFTPDGKCHSWIDDMAHMHIDPKGCPACLKQTVLVSMSTDQISEPNRRGG